jgi:hypothetical protein
MTDEENKAQPKTVPLPAQAGRGVVTFIIGAIVLSGLVLLAFLVGRDGEVPQGPPSSRDGAKQTSTTPLTKPQ